MSVMDSLTNSWRRLRDRWTYGAWRLPAAEWRGSGILRKVGVAVLVLILLYYPIGALIKHNVDDDLDFAGSGETLSGGQSYAVDMAAALIDREVNDKSWVPNDPFFFPSAILDNMPNYQQGILKALGRFSFELTDQIGRTRGSSQADADLQSAAGLLQYAPDVWHWDPGVSLMPRATSEAQYKEARRALLSYNERLASGNAVFERRADNLLATLDRIALDLGSDSAVLDQQIRDGGYFIDMKADDLFYGVKGKVYAYYMIIKGLSRDFENIIKERELGEPWRQLEESMVQVIELQPVVVVNGAPDAQFFPSHLAAQGFYLLRTRTQLREITNILLK